MGFRLSGEAEEDIIAIAEHGISVFGRAQAKRYHTELLALLGLIGENPRMARERTEIVPPVRLLPFKAHLIVYVVEEDDEVFVVRVRHGRENWETSGVPTE
ncbi:type II toxin-antitoxin system RelE/ParE family toxin [Ciceribacter sp. L1K23]|uniref:type II toxin-antitoxin system RelE/ParE family toxin n=1 Tax=Ciceribacter sp. L1K23 TaxID=2820276 RepID=UPI001B835E41|nr:type II toxin-antitoxin system RelE/ParE family toxin [Ciceribacter sp. L1K23]